MARTKFVTIESYGPIPALGGILGPITSPSYIDINVIISLINSGKVIYEVNPKNIKEKIRLTRDNVLKYNFNTTVKPEKISNVIKNTVVKPVDNIGLNNQLINDSSVITTITESKPEKIGIDLFISNKYS